MTPDRKRLEEIAKIIDDEQERGESYLLMRDKRWLVNTLKKYMDWKDRDRERKIDSLTDADFGRPF